MLTKGTFYDIFILQGGEKVNERIKALRKKLKLSQEEFGKRIGVGKTSISKIETGENNPSDQTVMLICNEFNVNEKWLRNGDGGEENIFIKTTPYQVAYNRFGYIIENSSPSKKAALTMLLELLYTVPDDTWELIMKQFEEIKKEG